MSIGGISGAGGGCSSLSEMRQMMFKRMDTNGDGVIDSSECQTAADNMSKDTGLSITAKDMMSIFDLDGDGSITQAEQTEASPTWEQHMSELMQAAGMNAAGPPPPPDQTDGEDDLTKLMGKIYAAMDTNGDGTVDQSELDAALSQIESGLEGSTASTASSGTTEGSATATGSATDTSTQNGLAALLQQMLQDIINYGNNPDNYASSQGQDTKTVNSYA